MLVGFCIYDDMQDVAGSQLSTGSADFALQSMCIGLFVCEHTGQKQGCSLKAKRP